MPNRIAKRLPNPSQKNCEGAAGGVRAGVRAGVHVGVSAGWAPKTFYLYKEAAAAYKVDVQQNPGLYKV